MSNLRLAAGTVLPFLLVTLIWGSTWIVIRDQLGDAPASWSVCYRFVIASLGMAIVSRVSGVSLAIGWRGAGFATLVGLAQFSFNFNFVYAAEAHITSGVVALVFALLLVPNTVLARLFFDQKVTTGFIVGSAVAIIGLALLLLHEYRFSPDGQGNVRLGIGLTLIAILCASSANVMQGAQIARRLPMSALLTWAMATGAAGDAAFAWLVAGPPPLPVRWGYWLGASYLALAGSVLAFPIYFGLIQRIGAARAAYISVLIPIFAMGLSTMFENYRWTELAALGVVLVMLGMVIALRSRQRAVAKVRIAPENV